MDVSLPGKVEVRLAFGCRSYDKSAGTQSQCNCRQENVPGSPAATKHLGSRPFLVLKQLHGNRVVTECYTLAKAG